MTVLKFLSGYCLGGLLGLAIGVIGMRAFSRYLFIPRLRTVRFLTRPQGTLKATGLSDLE